MSNSPTDGEEPSKPGLRGFLQRNQTLLSLLLPALLLGIGRGFTLPVLPAIAMGFGVSVAAGGLLVIAPMVGSVASTLPTGYFIDKVGRRRVLIVAPVLIAISAALVLRATTYVELVAYMFINGAGQQMWQMSRLAAIADSGKARQRGRQITGMAALQRFGSLGGPFIGGVVGELFGLRIPFAMFAVMAVLAAALMYLIMAETAPAVLARQEAKRTGKAAAAPTEPAPDTSWRALITRPVIALFIAQFSANVGRGGAQGQGGVYLLFAAYAFGVGPATLGTVTLATGLVGVPLTFLSGQIMDRFGRKRSVVPAAAVLGMGLALMSATAWFGWPFGAFVGSFVWINLAVSLMSGSMQTIGADVAPPTARGKFFGVNRLVAEAGSLGNPTAFSTATAVVAGGAGYALAFGVMGVFAFTASFVIGVFIRETLRKD
ncbi:MAG: MFS transporter [Chloroflexota bacterium]